MNSTIGHYQTMIDMLHQRVGQHPEKLAFEFLLDGENQTASLSYGELDLQARAIAATLQNLNIVGERVLLLFPPGLDYITAFWGCQYAGAIAVPTYPPDVTRLERSMPRFISIVNNAQPRVVLTTSPILALTQFLIAQFPELQGVHWLATDNLAKDASASTSWKYPDVNPDSLSFLQYTSGSTAEPKGVMLTHGNLIHQLEAIGYAFDLQGGLDRAVFWLPFYHDMGLIGGILGSLYFGLTATLMSPLDFLQRPLRWLQAITRVKASVSGGPNFAYELCVRKVTPAQKETLDLSSWNLAFNGAEPVRMDTLKRFAKAFEPCGFRLENFYPCYGLAEATLLVAGGGRCRGPVILDVRSDALARHQVLPGKSDQEGVNHLVGCGRAWLEHKIMIVDPETLTPCLEDENGNTSVGEIWFAGPSVAQGYWMRPEESERTFYAHLPGVEDRFLRTGDLGFVKGGELFVTGRIKDMIIIDGLNHYPQDIELTIEKCHPALRPGCSAAFSVEHAGQERLVVVAEVARGSHLEELAQQESVDMSAEAIIQVIRKAISNQHDLRTQDIVLLKPGSVSKTSSGKIQRHACKAGYIAGTLELWKP
jgi:acyl-CoA synthetase (AMP-forming)/AMP-acid ligase II